jgi:hypothetical protein
MAATASINVARWPVVFRYISAANKHVRWQCQLAVSVRSVTSDFPLLAPHLFALHSCWERMKHCPVEHCPTGSDVRLNFSASVGATRCRVLRLNDDAQSLARFMNADVGNADIHQGTEHGMAKVIEAQDVRQWIERWF